jgi:NADH-quinone oxidoreductase subunit L
MIHTVIQDPTLTAAGLAMLTPFLAFVLILIVTRRRPRLSAALSLCAAAVSLGSSVYLLARHWRLGSPIQYTVEWLSSGDFAIPFGLLLDPLSLLMLTVVTAICSLVQIYSLGYMAGDPGFSRYFAFMSLFLWAMISLVLSPSLLQLYVFWELVGVCSYLLIGFWYEKFSASTAGKKAFVMTRLGDVAFFLGILMVLLHLGNLDILELNSPAAKALISPAVITLASLLIFGGIIGKSAQFPLLTWLPDAMEGPTPVSALLHSATMVAAGVYLFARIFPFFSLSETAMTVFLTIGTISMLLAATMALVARDIKQVWAYSTISQLGYMIMALAAGHFFAGIFHLTTHAGFKALLFLCSGVFIHTYETNDMFSIGDRGGRRLKIPMAAMVIAAAALSGLPPLSGFFSKELIISGLAELSNPLWLAIGLAGVFLTAYYTFRLVFTILFPQKPVPQPAETHRPGHENAYWLMAWPLIILAAITLLLGFTQGMLEAFLAPHPVSVSSPPEHHSVWPLYISLLLAAGGVMLAWFDFGRPEADRIGFAERIPAVSALLAERWYIDRFYRWLLDKVILRGFSALCAACDNKVIDGAIHRLGRGTFNSGGLVSRLHAGAIQYKLMVVFAVILLLALYFLL